MAFFAFFSYTDGLLDYRLLQKLGCLFMSNHALKPLAHTVLAYTDGACRGNPGKGGYGAVVILPSGEQYDICGGDPHTTNNRMELMGAIAALENTPPELPIQIWSDSSYVIKGISEWLSGWKKKQWKNVKNVELWQRLDALCHLRKIDWQWVKGHAGHVGNEYADRLANQGIDQLPLPFLKTLIHRPAMMPSEPSLASTDVVAKKKDDIMNLLPSVTDAFDPLEDLIDDEDFVSDDIFLQALDSNESQTLPPPIPPVPTTPTVANSLSVSTAAAHFAAFTDERGCFVAQDDGLIAKRPAFNGVTSQPNPHFVPLLPRAKHQKMPNRQLILDTETTGFDPQNGDRIIEVGIVEMINRRFTGEKLHVYINPQRDMDDEVIRVHGIHNAFLNDMPVFEQVGQVIYEFLQGAELIAHNASFDMNFLHAEFSRIGLPNLEQKVTVTDSLAIAKRLYAGQRNTLDALVKRLNVGKQDRTFHGALLDAEILADVYLAMTGGQVALAIDDDIGNGTDGGAEHLQFSTTVKRFFANSEIEQAHQAWLSAFRDKNPTLADNWAKM